MCDCAGSRLTSPSAVASHTTSTPVGPTMMPAVPLASPIDLMPDPEGPLPGPSAPDLHAGLLDPRIPIPERGIPDFKLCRLNFRDGCYAMTFRPTGSLVSYEGTLRVDRTA